ncbi:hypothetical protein QZH41_017127, partial [Actinostola sp. cb2023]
VLFEGDNDFCVCIRESFPNLKVKKMRRVEWREIRRLMGKPRRFLPTSAHQLSFMRKGSHSMRREEKFVYFNRKRQAAKFPLRYFIITCIIVSELSKFKDLPEEVPLPLVIGTKVTARLRSPQDGLFTGQIEAVDTLNCCYRVTFDRPGLGTHSIPDTEVLSEEAQETMPLSSFLLKERPRTAIFPPTYTPPRYGYHIHACIAVFPPTYTPPRYGYHIHAYIAVFPPTYTPPRLKLQEALSQQGQGYANTTRLSKILLVKKECIEKLKEMNTQAEKMKSYQDPIDKDFQRRYACVVLELERLNKDLNDYLNGVQDYCQELAPEHGLHTLDQTISVKRKCDKEAVHMVDEQNSKLGSLSVKTKSTLNIINNLTSVLLQIKSLAENELNTFEFKSLSDAVEEIKSSIDPSNMSCFQNHVEIHVAHIQSGVSQMGNLHAFSS